MAGRPAHNRKCSVGPSVPCKAGDDDAPPCLVCMTSTLSSFAEQEKLMAKKFSELRAAMSPQARAQAARRRASSVSALKRPLRGHRHHGDDGADADSARQNKNG